MENIDPREHRKVDRRTFIKSGLIAGGAIAGAGLAIRAAADSDDAAKPASAAVAGTPTRASGGGGARQPNILVIVVDQLRFPQWFSPAPAAIGLPPNLEALREGAVSFARHYTASNDCTPSRSTLLTGLYTHQTGCMITGGSTLDPGFPTWGTMLREYGYRTRWLGKWHLTHHDNLWTRKNGPPALERYGFNGGVYPSPDGAPGQGSRVDPHISAAFSRWFANEEGSDPWCTTVSFVNPHDIAWWYLWSDRVAAEATAPQTVQRLPPNFETPQMLLEHGKPRLQRSFQDTAAASFGAVPFTGPETAGVWLEFLDLYNKIQLDVDRHIGEVLSTLESRPEVAANTVIVFTSDHGEYGASHGLRGKGASAYEEATRVPLIVKDPRGVLTTAPEQPRTQLTSSVDIAALLLTIASGSNEWRREEHYEHIASRLDLAAILADPAAPGRPYVLHATDETVTEFAIEPYAADAPLHVVGMRTPNAKFVTYSNWPYDGITPLLPGQEAELYDYSTPQGRLELQNGVGQSPLEEGLREEYQRAFAEELRGPLPRRLGPAHARGFADYFSTARNASTAAAARRKRRAEEGVPPTEQEATERSRPVRSRRA